uniref:BTB domain-containing protein n=1 Tax=Panagrellus redivivus TaxID=6233 RepID=A0A7E4W0E3_PANRE
MNHPLKLKLKILVAQNPKVETPRTLKPMKSDRLKSISKPRLTFQDIDTFTLYETDLTECKPGKYINTRARDVPGSDGLKWWIKYYPAGHKKGYKNCLSLFLHVTKPVLANYNFQVDGSSIEKSFTHNFPGEKSLGKKFTTHDALRPLFVDGRLSITCRVEFEIFVPNAVMAPRVGQCYERVPADVDLVVGTERLKVHKSLLSFVSPVFHAMLTNGTVEAPSDEIEVTEFDYGTVKTAIDFCYGRALENTSVESVIGVLRFADKYRINIQDQLEKFVSFNLKPESLAAALQYADESSKESLFNGCRTFFKRNVSDVTATDSFASLSPTLICRLLKGAFKPRTDLNVPRKDQKNGITFGLDAWEQRVIEQLSLDTFCDTCKYAWDCSRDNLKKECGKFFNINKREIINLEEFVKLSPEITNGVLKTAFDLL